MPSLLARLLDAVPLILEEWQVRMAQHPERSLPEEERLHHVELLLRRLLEAAVNETPRASAIRACLEMAAAHASHHRRQGIEWHDMLVDYDALRRAIWTQTERRARDGTEAMRAIFGVDLLIGDAVRASALGYYTESASAPVAWSLDEALDEIAHRSLLLAEG